MGDILRKRGVWIIIALLLMAMIGGIAYWFWWGATRLDFVSRAPDFTLQDLNNQPVQFHKEQGKVRVVEFFYANCPDICPLTTSNLVQIQDKLKKEGVFGKDVEFYAISFDPEHDKLDVLKKYAERMKIDPSGWKVLHGTEEQVTKVASDFGLFLEKQADGTFVHSTRALYLVDANNNIRKVFDMGVEMPTDEVEKDIRNLMREL
jgi:protein SCO1